MIGEQALIDLAEAFGGTRLYVPARTSQASNIAKAIGIEAARKLADRFAPDTIKVPLMREARALRLRDAGRSQAQIARVLGVAEESVQRLFRRHREGGL